MNMCLLEVVICEKCRSSHFQSEGGSEKIFRTGWVTDLGGGTFAGGVSTPLHAINNGNIRTKCEICSKLTKKTLNAIDVVLVSFNFEQISHVVLILPLLTLNK